MLFVGLTGNIGSGKTTVGHLFKQLGMPVYHADERGHYLLTLPEIKAKLLETFGSAILAENGDIDRKKLADIVFDDEKKLQQLNELIHPLVKDDFRAWAAKQKDASYVIKESAILFETDQSRYFDRIIVVAAPEDLRIQRVCKRDGTGREAVLKRARHQKNELYKIKYADFVVTNDDRQALVPQVLQIHKELINISGSGRNHP